MAFSVKTMTVGPLGENCYILKDDVTADGIVIDPGAEGERIISYIKSEGINLKAVVNTHAHWDHIGAVDEVRDEFDVPFAIHELDSEMVVSPKLNLSAFMGEMGKAREAERILQDGDEVQFGNSKLQVIHTPGHTKGGVCLYDGDKALFTGDTLFCMSVGRTDFPGGDMDELLDSIRIGLGKVHDEAVVYPGHGPTSLMGHERRSNPYL